ncbi:MAG TPA: hypothetical protein VNI01_11925 [Elusimicrobiota bacterium]|jgi:hypothetical protein|nr:hypothetical protein [Elusimicrobiota bacterium]
MKGLLALIALLAASDAAAQVDTARRDLIQLGYDRPLSRHAPVDGYVFYYMNRQLDRKDMYLRLVVAPVYLDSELGIRGFMDKWTDLGIGVGGGGFAQSYSEIRQGRYFPEESFTGNAATFSTSLYHRFNPQSRIPFTGVARVSVLAAYFGAPLQDGRGFLPPRSNVTYANRFGFRWGGMEPEIGARRAMELSSWYEARFRDREGDYGYSGDRSLNSRTHLAWGRALLVYTLPESGKHFETSLTAGTSASADRLNAYRLGGSLPMEAEFPLNIPGYLRQELSARRFALFQALYGVPVDGSRQWAAGLRGAAAYLRFLPGLEQPGSMQTGAGTWLEYNSPKRIWKTVLSYGYGFQALRQGGRGAHSISLVAQCNLRTASGEATPGRPAIEHPFWNTLQSIFR